MTLIRMVKNRLDSKERKNRSTSETLRDAGTAEECGERDG